MTWVKQIGRLGVLAATGGAIAGYFAADEGKLIMKIQATHVLKTFANL